MRVVRVLKRTLAVLLFLCMTLKIQLELRVLRQRTTEGFSPWWGNETLGHLRAFPKLVTRTNVTLEVLKTTGIPDVSLISKKTISVLASAQPVSALKASSGNVGHVPHQNGGNNDPNRSYRKILSDTTSSNNTVVETNSGVVSKSSRGIELNVTEPKSPSNQKTQAGIFAKLKIYDGENTIDTDTIYESRKRTNTRESLNNIGNYKSISQSRVKTETATKGNKKQVTMTQNIKTPSSSKGLRRSIVPLPKTRPASTASKKKVKESVTAGVFHDVDKNEMSLTKEEIGDIKEKLRQENEKQTVYNQEIFGPVLGNTTIFLVQVHKRLENLRYLVASLRAVRGIQEAMVIFSHDLWDPTINAFIRNITEFRVMQMFFPFSIQLYPLVFPGRDPADCSWNTKMKGNDTVCQNANWPDSYGHYREASFTQIKHHWWWKIHRTFEGLRVTQNNYTGHVVFLEEDHFVSPDLLHVLALMQRLRPTLCPICQMLALGNYNKLNPNIYKNFVEKGDWWVTKYNLGFAMNAALWRTLRKCKDQFCAFDDYNWDWTMNNVAQTCFPRRISMLSVRLSRVLHLGSCGTHVRKKGCDVQGEVRTAVARFSSSRQWLYPEKLVLLGSWKNSGKPKKGNGGWGDYRDKQLCRAIANSTADEETLTRLQAMKSI